MNRAADRSVGHDLAQDRLVDREDVAGAGPGSGGQQLERDGRAASEQRDTLACDQRKDRQVQLVHQALEEQVIPELPAQLYQDGAAGPGLERGDLRVEIRATDD